MAAWLKAETQRFWKTCCWSLAGWRAAWASEKSLRQWSLANLLSAALAFAVEMSPGERALILALGVLVLAAEVLNTAIEEIVDMVSPGIDARAGKAKDCGSAAVALCAIAAGIAWVVVLLG
ncbi:diacylglycerol kinase [Frigidibacter sp. ROC022]|uniref:diacylglycerol kinase n=1 Tax=Frigidibacter sp. ROC022 TaxID=2971796 RepID=UPI00215A407C|nr:diacylglycerol kinase [Frigidibacter sp. ROC022]MCR8726266.1 diacylglycerol kinase [Frigidibacter sp. ROC022]